MVEAVYADNTLAQPPERDVFSSATPRIPGIDGLRASAILIVMASHAGLGWVVPGGFGVTIFFFLSGYLITTLLRIEQQRTGTIHFWAFYGRRAVRILPPLYLTLLLVMMLAAAGLTRNPLSARSLGLDIIFLTNYAGALGVWATTPIPLWSLDVEEHFYIFFPVLFLILSSFRRSALPRLLISLCVAFLTIRALTYITSGPLDIYQWSHTRLDSIIYGALLAVWHNPILDRAAWQPRFYHVAGAIGIILVTLLIRSPAFRETLRYSLQGGALFVLFSSVIQSKNSLHAKILNGKALRVVALLSYTLYLVHLPLLEAMKDMSKPFAVVIAYVLSFCWAGIMYFMIEQPLARWRKRSLNRSIDRTMHKA